MPEMKRENHKRVWASVLRKTGSISVACRASSNRDVLRAERYARFEEWPPAEIAIILGDSSISFNVKHVVNRLAEAQRENV